MAKTRKTKQSKPKRDLYQETTDAIVAQLDKGVIPWRKPFPGYGKIKLPRNYNSDRPYRGINVFMLAFAGFGCPYWLTFKGAKAAGGQVRKGEKGTTVILWKPIRVDDEENPGKKKSILLLRSYTVFNVEQCDGIDPTRGAGEQPTFDHDPIEDAQEILGYYMREDTPTLRHVGNVAQYNQLTDEVTMPSRELWPSLEEYYCAAYHEAVHSTGVKSRLARKDYNDYAAEELTAEMGAAMLCAVAGISPATVQNSAAYIDHWRRKISEDPKLVIMAGARAQKAADYILGTTFEEDDKTEQPEAGASERELVAA